MILWNYYVLYNSYSLHGEFYYWRARKYLEVSRLFRLNFAPRLNSGQNIDKEKISVQKLFSTANQNNSVINSYYNFVLTFNKKCVERNGSKKN